MITATHPLSVYSLAPSLDHTPRYTVEVESYSPSFAIVRAAGDLDMTARIQLTDTLAGLGVRGAHIVVDLSGVEFMYSGAANAVIDAASTSEATVQVFAPTRPVRMIFEALGAQAFIVDSISAR
nr:STAS domain-containing protein [Rhodococcus sp. (in: high G+C Gram-positive bacteria)]